MNLIKKFKDANLRNKILSTYTVFFALIIIVFFAFYIQNVKNTQNYTINYMNQINSQMNLNVDTILANMERLNYLQFYDDQSRLILKKDGKLETYQKRMENELYMRNTLNHLFRMNEFVARGTLISRHGDVYTNISTDIDRYVQKIKELDNKKDWSQKDNVYYTNVYETFINQQRYQIMTLIRKLYYYDSDLPLATLAVDLDYQKICSIFDNYYAQNSMSSFAVLNHNALIYSSPESHLHFEESFSEKERERFLQMIEEKIAERGGEYCEFEIEGVKYIVTAQRNSKTGWMILQYIPLSELRDADNQNMKQMLFMLIVIGIGTVFLSIFLSRHISRPLEILDSTLKKPIREKVELLSLPEDLSDDEVGRLMRNYNAMAQRINDNIEKNYVYELNQRRTQLKMLQFQINPHFLYNTLNAISSIAEISDVPQIVSISDSLSKMLRYNIKGRDIVKLEEELEQSRRYLLIQSMRFPEKFETLFQISPEASNCKILKFLLQPILENVISHGFSNIKKNGKVEISASLEQNFLKISVWDNGKGISSSQLETLNQRISTLDSSGLTEIKMDDEDTSIGLYNVAARIKNYYGTDCELLIESEEGKYTEVILRLKAEKWSGSEKQ